MDPALTAQYNSRCRSVWDLGRSSSGWAETQHRRTPTTDTEPGLETYKFLFAWNRDRLERHEAGRALTQLDWPRGPNIYCYHSL